MTTVGRRDVLAAQWEAPTIAGSGHFPNSQSWSTGAGGGLRPASYPGTLRECGHEPGEHSSGYTRVELIRANRHPTIQPCHQGPTFVVLSYGYSFPGKNLPILDLPWVALDFDPGPPLCIRE